MAVTTNISLGTMIDESLDLMYRAVERPGQVIMGATALNSAVAVNFTLGTNTDGAYDINTTDVLEYGQELLLVTDKTLDTVPIYTVQRGFLGSTPNAAIPTGSVILTDPKFPRRNVAREIQRAFSGPISKGLPYYKMSAVETVGSDTTVLSVPADVLRPLSLLDPYDGSTLIEHGQFDFFEHLPSSISSTGNAIRLPTQFSMPYNLVYLEYAAAYPWSDSPVLETSTVPVYYGAEDLASLWTAWFLVSSSELSRVETADINDFATSNPNTLQVNYQVVKGWKAMFDMRMEEARAMRPSKQMHRPYRRMRKI